MRDESTRRRACLLGLAMLMPVAAVAAEAPRRRRQPPRPTPAPTPRDRAPSGGPKKQAAARPASPPPARPSPAPPPQSRAAAGDVRKQAAGRAAPPAPQIDGPPPPSRRPGLEPAPVLNGNILPPLLIEGQSFRANDVSPQARQQQESGPRLPSPGATVRLPF